MKIVYSWLKKYISADISLEKTCEILTDIGLEVEGIKAHGDRFTKETLLVGEVTSVEQHPNADKLKIASVNIGEEKPLSIVCGAPNLGVGQKVPVATIGTTLTNEEGESFKIKKSKLRGEHSYGMICSEKELGLGTDNSGIWVLNTKLEVGKPLAEQIKLKDNDAVIEIGLTPNRADAMSHYGVARDLAAALSSRKIAFTWNEEAVEELISEEDFPLEIQEIDSAKAPRYAGRYLKNIEVKESPEWLKKMLSSLGIAPKNNVVDITNYILHDLGQPLHAFDAAKINGAEIRVKSLEKDTVFTTLDEKQRKLNQEDLMICDKDKAMCIAGVFGGIDSGVSDDTKEIFLESAYFDPISIRKSAKFHALNTDASFRFERGIDPNITIEALNKATQLLTELANAQVVGPVFDHYPNPIANKVVIFRYSRLDKLAGNKIHREQVKQILKSLEISVISENNDNLELEIPAYRVDVTREVDVIEEVLRIYGFNNIANEGKTCFTVESKGSQSNKFEHEKKLSNHLAAIGFTECLNNSLVNQTWNKSFYEEREDVLMLNPLSQELSNMRKSLLPGLLSNASYNHNRGQIGVQFFEFGKNYSQYNNNFVEEKVLALFTSGKTISNWNKEAQNQDFFRLKGILENLLERLGLKQWEEIEQNENNLNGIKGISSNIEIFNLGKVNKAIKDAFDFKPDCFFLEIYWDRVLTLVAGSPTKFKNISKFPESKRDLALIVPQNVSFQDIQKVIEDQNNSLIKSIELFDVYEGEKIPKNTKSYAISLTLRDDSKTITDKQIDKVVQDLLKKLQNQLNIKIRD